MDDTNLLPEPVEQQLDVEGQILDVRPMEPGFADALVAFHDSLSPATIRNRFFAVHPHLTADEVARFCGVDHHDREAYAVFDDDAIVAVARLDRLGHDADHAEIAFVVADHWQHRTLGTTLLHLLAARARELGIAELVAETLATNAAMQSVLRHAGLPCHIHYDDGIVDVTIALDG